MNYAEIITILNFKEYKLNFNEFKKILPYINVKDIYVTTENNMCIRAEVINESGNIPISEKISITDLYLKEE